MDPNYDYQQALFQSVLRTENNHRKSICSRVYDNHYRNKETIVILSDRFEEPHPQYTLSNFWAKKTFSPITICVAHIDI